MNPINQVQTYLEPVMKRSQQQTQTTSTGHVPVGSATKSRRGFTLVELLMVMAIIGILIGMFAAAIGPVMTRVYDGAVSTEMGQIELAVESFKNKHGFYPPSFRRINNVNQLLPYINRISPNHRESGASLSRWWTAIGDNLDDRSSLVFWLAGLSSNKQFPITGGLPMKNGNFQLPAIYGGNDSISVDAMGDRVSFSDQPDGFSSPAEDGSSGRQIDIPRDTFFDFKGAQLSDLALDLSDNTVLRPIQLLEGIKVYTTPYGDEADDRGNEYFYRNSEFYEVIAPNGMRLADGVYHAFDDRVVNGNVVDPGRETPIYVNPRTFQLFTYGLDGLAVDSPLNDLQTLNAEVNLDNITNFANGRLEAFEWRANLGLER